MVNWDHSNFFCKTNSANISYFDQGNKEERLVDIDNVLTIDTKYYEKNKQRIRRRKREMTFLTKYDFCLKILFLFVQCSWRKIIIFSLKPNQGSEKEPHNLLTIGLFIKIYVRLSSKLVYLWFIFQILLCSLPCFVSENKVNTENY